MTELFINHVLVDTQKAEIALTMQAFAFDSLGTRKGSFSNVFDLAKSNSNRALFDNCDIVTSLTNLPYQKNRCQIFIDGILIVEGSAIILETKENYRVSISAGNSSVIIAIESLSV